MLRRIAGAMTTALMLAFYQKQEERNDMSRDHLTDAETVASALHNLDETLERVLLMLERIANALEGEPQDAIAVELCRRCGVRRIEFRDGGKRLMPLVDGYCERCGG
jgi:hypothetical protein